MVSKNNKKLIAEQNRRNERQRFALRKLNVGVASVLLGITFSIYGGSQVVAHADTTDNGDQAVKTTANDGTLAGKSEVALSNNEQRPALTLAASAGSSNARQTSAQQSTAVKPAGGADQVQSQTAAASTAGGQTAAATQPAAQNQTATAVQGTAPVANQQSAAASNSAVAEDPNSVTVTDAAGFINALATGTATTINVGADINLATQTDSVYKEVVIKNKRDIVIQSATPGVKRTIDFSGYSFDMDTQNGVTFKDLDLYARSYWGVVYDAGGYVFDNVTFTGSQLVYTKPSINSTVTFKNNVTATAVGSYTSPLDGKVRSSQGGNTQQILQFEGGTNRIVFADNSNVTLTTTNSNLLEIDGGATTIDVQTGANVSLNPHSKGNPEQLHGIGTGRIARAIASNGNTTLNIASGAKLNINLQKDASDSDLSGALYLNSGAAINTNGTLTINSNGKPNASRYDYIPVYINGTATINVGNGGDFVLTATNLDNYSNNLMYVNGKGTVDLAAHSSFKVSADGSGALTAINLSDNSTFSSDQPDAFTIDLSKNTSSGKALIKNGTINFSRVKTVSADTTTTSEPLGKIDVTYDANGNVSSYTIVAQDENTVKQVTPELSNKSFISLIQAGQDVTLTDVHLDKNNLLTGTVASGGDDNPIYVTVTVNGQSTNVPVAGNYTVYTNTNGTVTAKPVAYAAETSATGGNFSIQLPATGLNDTDTVAITATKDFVNSPTVSKTVAELRAVDTTTLKGLVDAVPAQEAQSAYYNAPAAAQAAYRQAIAEGQAILSSTTPVDQSEVDTAVAKIQTALSALTGQATDLAALQTVVKNAGAVESSTDYTNADANLQAAYQTAVAAGKDLLTTANATQAAVDQAVAAIKTAQAALNGDSKLSASRAALQQAVDNAATVRATDPAYYNGSQESKRAYDDAVTAGQAVLANPQASAAEIDQALTKINNAQGKLDGTATNKAALQSAVDGSATVQQSASYTDASPARKTAYDQAVSAAQTVLTNANATQAQVNDALAALNSAAGQLDGINNLKASATAAVQTALDSKLTEINAATNVDQSTKDQLTAAANRATAAANTAIADATTAAAINAAQTTGVTNINQVTVPSLTGSKDAALKTVEDALAKQTALINAATNLSTAEQQELITRATAAANDAKANVNAATTNAGAANAAQAGVAAIEQVVPTSLAAAQAAANQAVDDALAKKLAEINAAPALTTEEKTKLTGDANAAAQTAKNKIAQASTNDGAAQAGQAGVAAIANVSVPAVSAVKQAAKDAIAKAAQAKDAAIDGSSLTAEEKAALKKTVADAVANANGRIDAATTDSAVAAAQAGGEQTIKDIAVPQTSATKTAALEAIETALQQKVAAINSATELTTDEQQELVKQATAAAAAAKQAVNDAATAQAVENAKAAGIANIEKVTVPDASATKTAAIKTVNDALTTKTAAINDAPGLTAEEKQALTTQAQTLAKEAIAQINAATTNADVTTAKDNGVAAINGLTIPAASATKQQADGNVDQAVEDAKQAVDNTPGLTAGEKQAAKDQIDQAAQTAKGNISHSTTNTAVTTAAQDGILAIKKAAALAAIDGAAAVKNGTVNGTLLTAEEKQDLMDQVAAAANGAKDAINAATTVAGVTTAKDTGIADINKVTVPTGSAVKMAAKDAVQKAAESKLSEINAAPALTAEEKAALVNQVKGVVAQADRDIDAATSNALVQSAREKAISAINAVTVPATSPVKDQADGALDKAAAAAKDQVDNTAGLSAEEKQTAKNQIDQALQQAKENVAAATTDEGVENAQAAGLLTISKVTAKAAIDAAAAAKKSEIAQAPLTTDEAQTLTNLVEQKAAAAKAAIDAASTISAVDQAKDEGVTAINGVKVPAASPVKAQADQAIDAALANKTKEINGAANLSPAEKQALLDQANQAAAQAKERVDAASTDAAANQAAAAGVTAIANVTVPSLADAKQDALQAIEDVLKQKVAEINGAAHLTAQEKQDLISQAQQAADNAKDRINQATTNDDAVKQRDAGVQQITNVKVPTLAEKRAAALAAIDEALAAKQGEINNAANLSDQEKASLTSQAEQAAAQVKASVNQATDDAGVAQAASAGVAAIMGIKVPGLGDQQAAAVAALDEAKKNKLAEIAQAANLTATEKDKLNQQVNAEYQQALAKVNQATTNDAVERARTAGVTAIMNVKVPTLAEVKQAQIAALEEVRAAKQAEINRATNISQAEKEALLQKVANVADNAIDQINAAQNDQEAAAAEEAGIKEILNVTVRSLDEVKANGKQAVADALQNKLDDIAAAANLDAAAKQDLVDQAKEEAATADAAIDRATTNDQAFAAANTGVGQILGITVPTLADAKQAALSAIADALKQKQAEINSAVNLTAGEKQHLLDEASQLADQATAAVDQADTNQDVEQAAKAGVQAIQAIQVPTVDQSRDQAISKIDQALATKQAEINAAKLSSAVKQELLAAAGQAAAHARTAVHQATTAQEIAAAEAAGIAAIEGIQIPAPATDDQVGTGSRPQATGDANNPQPGADRPAANAQSSAAGGLNGTGDHQQTGLPQTGNNARRDLSAAGLLLASLVGFLGLAGFRKKQD
ncbi:DUF1542 domain-containing protein [Limosilactobacillus antri]|uniref:DUF1542 domain-containing protein n=1 Tax=Limosilactobacillus antri TaxID=227943 RepID=UPI001F59C284|nr:DUF1542 domain-containing protein [Limosilactobacillus antri]